MARPGLPPALIDGHAADTVPRQPRVRPAIPRQPGLTVLPGLFDCHVHLTLSSIDTVVLLNKPFSLQFFEAARNMAATLATASPWAPTLASPRTGTTSTSCRS